MVHDRKCGIYTSVWTVRFRMDSRIHREQPFGREEKADNGERAGDVVATVERVHRIFVFPAFDDHNADDRCEQAEGTGDERK